MLYLVIFKDILNGYSYFRLTKRYQRVKQKVVSEYWYKKKMGIRGSLSNKLDMYGYDTLHIQTVIPFIHHTNREDITAFMDSLMDELRNRGIDIV
jgi:hypothetical protein